MCDCLKRLCAQEQIRELSKLLDLGEQSFDTFRLDYYSQAKWPGRGVSPRENMELVYEVCLNYAQKFGRFYFKNLFLSGAPGLGKTFLSACIARSVSEQGKSVVYDTAGSVFAQFENRKFLRDQEDLREARDETRRYLGCDLLILDEACAAWQLGAVDREMLRQAVLGRPEHCEVVLTGREPADWMKEAAHYSTEMVCHSHPFDRGTQARPGIEF
mgnify:CR=1 FL=1